MFSDIYAHHTVSGFAHSFKFTANPINIIRYGPGRKVKHGFTPVGPNVIPGFGRFFLEIFNNFYRQPHTRVQRICDLVVNGFGNALIQRRCPFRGFLHATQKTVFVPGIRLHYHAFHYYQFSASPPGHIFKISVFFRFPS